MSELLESRWSDTKNALLEGLSGTKKSVMATTLENTRRYLSESATAGATSEGTCREAHRPSRRWPSASSDIFRSELAPTFNGIENKKKTTKTF